MIGGSTMADNKQLDPQRFEQMTLADIEALPEDQREQVWEELAKQISLQPGFEESVKQLDDLSRRAADAMREWTPKLQQFAQALIEPLNESKTQLKQMSAAVAMAVEEARKAFQENVVNVLSDETIEALRYMQILAPYMEKELKDHADDYKGDASVSDLIAVAAQKARKDGIEIPPLKAESPRQLSLLTDETSKEGSATASLIGALKTIQTLTPASHIMPNNALMNILQQKPAINAGAFDLTVANGNGKRGEITNYTIISYEPDESGITITDPKISEYERQVSDAIISLWVEAQKQSAPAIFTTDMIYRAMPGSGDKASPRQRGAITKAIERFRRLHITMDVSEEMRKRGQSGADLKNTMDEPYLMVKRFQQFKVKHSNQRQTGYLLVSEPIMLTYSRMTNQILTIKPRFIEIKKVKGGKISTEPISMTVDRQAMTGYLTRRIAIMKHDYTEAKDKLKKYNTRRKKDNTLAEKKLDDFRKQSPHILFDTVFSETGTATTERTQENRNRDFCFDVLDYWVASGFIAGYQKYKKGKKVVGITIDLD